MPTVLTKYWYVAQGGRAVGRTPRDVFVCHVMDAVSKVVIPIIHPKLIEK